MARNCKKVFRVTVKVHILSVLEERSSRGEEAQCHETTLRCVRNHGLLRRIGAGQHARHPQGDT
jgi:hypothetical protein